MKKITIISLCLLLILPSFLTFAATGSDDEAVVANTKEGSVASKDEVVYATLNPDGSREELYIVNALEVTEAGIVEDFGDYTSLKNLTDLSPINKTGEKIEVIAEEGRFYYQGNMDTELLPWDFNIEYLLDGKVVALEELAGVDGNVEIKINSSANEAVDARFFENYLLQISLLLDAEKTMNIQTEDGMLANAGKDFQITFTVMPEEEGNVSVSADVQDFEFNGIDIAAIPSSMSIDPPDTDELTTEMRTLSDAISEINNGVSEMKDGAAELHQGTSELREGSKEYHNGILALDSGSDELVSGSAAINDALELMSDSLSTVDDIDLSQLGLVIDGLNEISDGLREVSGGLTQLLTGYNEAYSALNGAMNAIPNHQITEEEIGALYLSGADKQTIDRLVEVYSAALVAKGTYDQVKEAFQAIDSTLATIIPNLNQMADGMDQITREFSTATEGLDISGGMQELTEGIATLSTEYKTFNQGIMAYTNGVSQLATNYQQLDGGIAELNNGTGEFANGLSELHDGTSELDEATNNIPEQMTEEIDKIISEFDKSDFEAVSFVSEQNENVNSVQFVLTTKGIENGETEEVVDVKEEKSFWQKFLDLFR
ncbi:YhgE/Pip domain-containing protein [Oceanobacillus sp. CAU 1775]